MAKTTTATGRLNVRTPDYHFDVDDDYGAALFSTLQSAWELISDNIGTRWFANNSLEVGAIASFDHNFGLHLTKLMLYYHQDGDQLTKVEVASKFSAYYVTPNVITVENISSQSETFDLTVLSWKFDQDGQIDLDALERLGTYKVVVSDSTGGLAVSSATSMEAAHLINLTENIQARFDLIASANTDSRELSGFANTLNPMSYNPATRSLELGDGNPFILWISGHRYVKTSEGITLHSDDGSHWISYSLENGGVIEHTDVPFDILNDQPVAYIESNSLSSPTSFAVRETHGTMERNTHRELHENFGSYRISGFEITGYTVDATTNPNSDNPTNAENTFAIASGVMADEDIRDTIAALVDGNGTGANHTHMYADGLSIARWHVQENFPFHMGTTYPMYNKLTGASWSLLELTAPTINTPKYMNVFCAVQLALHVDFQHLFIPGQAEFGSLTAAQAETWDSLDKSWIAAPEVTPIAKITYRAHNTWSNTGRVRIEALENLYGTRNSRISQALGASLTNATVSAVLAWATGTIYAPGAVATYNNMTFQCLVAHTSGTFLTDFGNDYWMLCCSKVQNRQDNLSAVPGSYASDSFPSVNNLQSATFTFAGSNSYQFLISLSTGEGVVVTAAYKTDTINYISDPSAIGLYADSGGGIYVSKSANSANIVIKNRTGGIVGIGVIAIHSNISDATAWA